jgi:hypothetical protein
LPVTAPGSAIISLAKDGEIKVWQPLFSSVSRVKASVDKIFIAYSLQWRLSGLFTTLSTDAYSRSFANPKINKMNGCNLESASIDPSCMNMLVTFRSGLLELWQIPGLIDDKQGSLATVQDALWRNTECHSDVIFSANVWTHVLYSIIHDVDLGRSNTDRFEIVKELAAYVRGTMSNTVGYTYNEMKLLSQYSSMTTSSKDMTVILWQFSLSSSSLSSSNSVYLYPVPCRRFICSNIPRNGLCYCTTYVSNLKADHTMWRAAAIVNGIVVSLYEDIRSKIFKQDPNILTTSYIRDGDSLVSNLI